MSLKGLFPPKPAWDSILNSVFSLWHSLSMSTATLTSDPHILVICPSFRGYCTLLLLPLCDPDPNQTSCWELGICLGFFCHWAGTMWVSEWSQQSDWIAFPLITVIRQSLGSTETHYLLQAIFPVCYFQVCASKDWFYLFILMLYLACISSLLLGIPLVDVCREGTTTWELFHSAGGWVYSLCPRFVGNIVKIVPQNAHHHQMLIFEQGRDETILWML